MTSVETGLVTDVIIGLGINFSIADFPKDLKKKQAAYLCHLHQLVVMSSSAKYGIVSTIRIQMSYFISIKKDQSFLKRSYFPARRKI